MSLVIIATEGAIAVELREYLFSGIKDKRWHFAITCKDEGVFSGADRLKQLIGASGIKVYGIASEGDKIRAGDCVASGTGIAEEITRAEEMLLGVIGKTSGVATAAAGFVKRADGRVKIVCGAWKKVAPEIRSDLRLAIHTGGSGIRITDEPFIYIDKNYVRLLGCVGEAVKRAREYDDSRIVVVQLKGEIQPITDEAVQAVEAGAGIIMVDTGRIEDLKAISDISKNNGWHGKVKLAYAGGVTPDCIETVIDSGAEIVDVGRAIIDAPMLDFSLDVLRPEIK